MRRRFNMRPKDEILNDAREDIPDHAGVYVVELLADIRDQVARLNSVLEDVANLTAEQVELLTNRAGEEVAS
jgi:hypothetical protein